MKNINTFYNRLNSWLWVEFIFSLISIIILIVITSKLMDSQISIDVQFAYIFGIIFFIWRAFTIVLLMYDIAGRDQKSPESMSK